MKSKLHLPLTTFIIVALISLFSCSKSNDPTISQKSIWPFAIGNEWIYNDSTYNMYSWSAAYDTIRITNKTAINGIDGYYMNSSAPNDPIVCLNSDEQGNCVFIGGTSNINQIVTQSIIFKNYPKIGEKWILNQLNYNEKTGFVVDTVSYICEGIDIPIKTIGGTFSCNTYSHTYYSGTNKHNVDKFIDYFARGIGRIKSIHYENEKKQSISTLIKYKIQ